MHYVIGDVHGCYDEMMTLIEKIEMSDSHAQIIFLGDFIDRGPKVWDVLQWTMKNVTPDGKYQSVRGNHEQLIIEWYQEFLSWHVKKRYEVNASMPDTTFDFKKWLENMNYRTPDLISPIVDFFESLPFSKCITVQTKYGRPMTYRLVHGCYNYYEPQDSDVQKECNLWERNYWGMPGIDEVIIHGHTPTISIDYLLRGCNYDRPGMICYRQNAINLDGGCCFFKTAPEYPCMLCAICLETLEEIYPYTLEERFNQNQENLFWELGMKEQSEEIAIKRIKEYEKKFRHKNYMAKNKIMEKMGWIKE